MAEKLDETKARQGRTGKPMLIVLGAGLALIVVGYIIVGAIGVATSPDGSLEQTESIEAADPQENNAVSVPE